MKIFYLNISDGCQEAARFDKIIQFINKKNPDVIGLSELDNWDKNNFKKLKEFQKKLILTKLPFVNQIMDTILHYSQKKNSSIKPS